MSNHDTWSSATIPGELPFEEGKAGMDSSMGDYSYDRAMEAIARARQTGGPMEGGLWRTAFVESAAAITEALFEVAGSISGLGFNSEEVISMNSRLRHIAEAIEKLGD